MSARRRSAVTLTTLVIPGHKFPLTFVCYHINISHNSKRWREGARGWGISALGASASQ